MSRPKSPFPAYCHHKSDGRAVAYIGRKSVYLGKYNSPESRQRYGELLARLARGESAEATGTAPQPVAHSVGKLCLKFTTEELPRYADAGQHCIRW
jgi:hypothetical protein